MDILGKAYISASAVELVKEVMSYFPQGAFKRLRADCGFFSSDFIKAMLELGLEYYIDVPLQSWVQRLILQIRSWHEMTGYSGISYAELKLPFKKWEKVRFVVVRTEVKRGEKPKKRLSMLNFVTSGIMYDYQVITTSSKKSAKEVWKFYNKRANCENMIKEGIYSHGLDKTISQSFCGNALWFQIVMFAYNLMNWCHGIFIFPPYLRILNKFIPRFSPLPLCSANAFLLTASKIIPE